MMVAEKICEIEYNTEILYKLYLKAEDLSKRVREFCVIEYEEESITFAMN